jgi:DNA-binding MarR family transcriptional regulator
LRFVAEHQSGPTFEVLGEKQWHHPFRVGLGGLHEQADGGLDLRTEMESELQTFGLRTRHLIALTLLREFGERGQTELAEAMWVDPTNLVGLLNELEASDLIERRRSPQDRRRHPFALTLAGHRRLAEIGLALAGVEQRVLKALNTDEQATLYALLHRAVAAAAECTERPPTSNACGGHEASVGR